MRLFEVLFKDLSELFNLGRDDVRAIRLFAILIKIILMIIFSRIEHRERLNLSYDRPIESLTFI
jgi:hypothetical protein